MKNKVILFLISFLVMVLLPTVSRAVLNAPDGNLTVVINTFGQGSDTRFCFSHDFYYIPDGTSWSDGLSCTNIGDSSTAQVIVPIHSASLYHLLQWTNSGVKPNNIICTSDNPNEIFTYNEYGVDFGQTIVGENVVCTFNEYKKKTPVLIVPGLLGTEMKKGDELLWADIPRMANPLNSDNFMDPLSFDANLTPGDLNVTLSNVIGIKSFFGYTFDYTAGLVNEFKNQGYVEGQNLFMFPYDWRYGVSGKYSDGTTNEDLLKQKIDSILQETGATKVDIVAHSLGGLIVKKYAMDNPTTNHIGKAVFVGVPNTGSPKVIKTLLQGDNMGVLGLSDAEIRKIATNMPSAYDLLPSQQYYNIKGSYIETIDQTKCFNDLSVPCDVKNLDYQESNSFLLNQNLNATAITQEQSLHSQSYDNFDMRTAGVDLYAIDGCKTATLGKVIQTTYNDIFGQQVSYDARFSPGDKTVPLESATNLPIDSSKKYYALISDHGKMPSQNGIRHKIVNVISGSNLDTGSAYGQPLITQDISKCQLNGKVVSVFSPVNVSATDQSGNKLGLAEDGSIANEIPGADFEIIGDHKFIYLPQDGGQTYMVIMQGTGNGTYTIKSQSITNNQIGQTDIFNDLLVTPELTGQINIGSSQTTLSVAQSSGSVPQTILPTKTLDYSTDKTSPEAVIYFDLAIKDLKFYGIDNLSESSSIPIADNENSITVTDEAGNATEINFSQKNRRAAMSAEMMSIKYNGVPVTIASNVFSYSWSFDKLGKLTKLTQKVKSRNNYSLTAVYDGSNTTINGTTSTGKISQTFSGLKIVKVTTNNGDLSWGY